MVPVFANHHTVLVWRNRRHDSVGKFWSHQSNVHDMVLARREEQIRTMEGPHIFLLCGTVCFRYAHYHL